MCAYGKHFDTNLLLCAEYALDDFQLSILMILRIKPFGQGRVNPLVYP